jgi:glutamate N-acetyltransferase/amino-acid N-acetyltransferase
LVPAQAACCFTSNTIKAAPVIVDRMRYARSRFFRAILANSGNANCHNGRRGVSDALAAGDAFAGALGIPSEQILLASTGIIGKRLPVERLVQAAPQLAAGLSRSGIGNAARAILTTDTRSKEVTARCVLSGKPVTICGIAKGAGMISPSMATMLAFILTDASVQPSVLRSCLRSAVDASFNCITVDGCMSTNDTVILLANGCASNAAVRAGRDLRIFSAALSAVCLRLAQMIVRDAEGITKFITIRVRGAQTRAQARRVGLAIANSSLFKTAMYGENPNYGRIAAAAGASGVRVQESALRVRVSPLRARDITVEVSIGRGQASATVYTSDLSPEYIKINAEYT